MPERGPVRQSVRQPTRRVPDLLDLLIAAFTRMAIRHREMELGYPQLRSRIEAFIATQPEPERDKLRSLLMPTREEKGRL
jgi:hypothetical protein